MSEDDLVRQAVRRAIQAKAQAGEITFSELNALLEPTHLTASQIDWIINQLAENGIHLVEDDVS